MTVTIHSPFKAAPRISEDKWIHVLESVGSFDSEALWGTQTREGRIADARACYRVIVAEGHDPGRWLGIMGKEHNWGTNLNSVLGRNQTHSATNARSIRDPDVLARTLDHYRHDPRVDDDGTIYDASRRSRYAIYVDITDSLIDGMYRIDDPTYAYKDAVSIVEVISIFAPSDDDNKPVRYAQTMCDWLNGWMATDTGNVPQPPREGPPMALTDTVAQRIRDKGVEVHDIRGRMRRHATERYRRLPNTAWLYTGVHHTAVSRGVRGLQGDIDSWVGHSVYHVGTHGWPGIAYAIGVSLSGRVFILRDIEEEGYHAFSANNNSIGICGDLTTGNTITEPFKRSLNAVLEVLHAAPEFPNLKDRAGTYGHRELAFVDQRNSGTSCPGDVLPLVREYRAGRDTTPPDASNPPAIPTARPDPWGTSFWIPEVFIHEIGAQEWMLTGYAKSEAFVEGGLIVQYFERARLEIQPDGRVTRGLVGTEAMIARYPERG